MKRVLDEYEPLPYFPIVAFSEKADLKVKAKNATVIYWGQIPEVIGRYDKELLSWDKVAAIRDTILAARLEPGRETEKQHVKDVRKAK